MEMCNVEEEGRFEGLSDALNGDIRAQFELGVSLEEVQQDIELAASWFKKAALQGHVEAAYRVGMICLRQEKTWDEAAYWLHLAAVGGNHQAQSNLADMYESGKGVKLDFDAAMYWHREAAQRGNALSKAKIDNLSSFFDL